MVLATHTPTGAPRVCTRGRPMPLSPTMSPPLPTILLVAMDTTSMVLATHIPIGAPRVCTRGRPMPLSPTMSPPLPTILLVAMDTTSMVLATLTPTGAPRVCTRGMSLAAATSMWIVMTAMDTTVRTQSMVSRLTATMPMSMRTERGTEALSGHAREYENVPVYIFYVLKL